MENNLITKQIIDFHKATFDNIFNSSAILQEQAEQMVNTFLLQATFIPEEGKKTIREWVNDYKKGRIDFKDATDKNYKKVEEYFALAEVTAKEK